MTKQKTFHSILELTLSCTCYIGAALGAYQSNIEYVIFFLGFLIIDKLEKLNENSTPKE